MIKISAFFIICIGLGFSLRSEAQARCRDMAAPPAASFKPWAQRLQSPVSRFVFDETPEGTAVEKFLNISDRSTLARELSKANPHFQRQLYGRLEILHESLQRLRLAAVENSMASPVDSATLNETERFMLGILAERYLKLGDVADLNPETLAQQPIEFFTKPIEGLDPADEMTPRPRLEDSKLSEWSKDLWDWMKSCMEAQPRGVRTKSLTALKASALGSSLFLTGFGSISHTGMKEIKWGELSTDLIINGLASLVGFHIISKNSTVLVRYVKIVGYNLGLRNSGDGVVYFFRPRVFPNSTEKNKVPDMHDTLWRYTFNATWAFAMNIPNILIFDILSGLTCVTADSSMLVKAIPPAASWGSSMALSYMYFNTRPLFLQTFNPPVSDTTK